MPITRTPMIDDDGSGTTGTIINNAWKQELYNQIDAAGQGPLLTWTATGPNVGTLGSGNYIQAGALTFVFISLTWPTTADGGQALFSLPHPSLNLVHSSLVQSYGPAHHRLWIANLATGYCNVLNGATGAQRINSEMSGQQFIVSGVYL